MPWQVSAGIGAALFVGLKWILPAMSAGNMFLKPMSSAFANLAWLFSGVFFIIGAVVFLKEQTIKKRQANEQGLALTKLKPDKRQEPTAQSYQRTDHLDAAMQATPEMTIGKPSAWSIELLREIEWKRFEDVCQQFYELKGIRSETTALGPDGGIDIRLYQDDSCKATSIVQCKAWGEKFVGVKPIRELLGVMTHEKIVKSFFMTSGYYSDDAKAVAQANRITLIDGDMLLMMIRRLPAEAQQKLLNFAVAGDYATPTCPTCGIKMKHVTGKEGRPDFWGCHDFPRCRQRLGMRRT